jgi:hypothetical protein
MVEVVSYIFVPAFTAIELVLSPATPRLELIVAIPAVENILTLVSGVQPVGSVAPLDNIVARSSEDEVSSAEAAYLVIAVLTGQLVWFVGA